MPTPSRIRSVLEPVVAHVGTFDARAMARGRPGVPARFDWRGTTYSVVEVLEEKRETEREGRVSTGEEYAKRHVSRVRVDTGEVMVLSASRDGRRGAARWILRSVETPEEGVGKA